MRRFERYLWKQFHKALRARGWVIVGDDVSIFGYCKIIETATGIVVAENHNQFVTTGKTAIGDALIDAAAQWDTGITYIAIGTGSGTPGLGDTTLGTEAGTRQTIDTKSRSGNTLTFTTAFLAAECNIGIEEMGLFGTSTAGGAADSGVMFARSLVPYDNTDGSGINLTMQYFLRIGLIP